MKFARVNNMDIVASQTGSAGKKVVESKSYKKRYQVLSFCLLLAVLTISFISIKPLAPGKKNNLLNTGKLNSYISYFNSIDSEYVRNYVTNDNAFDFLSRNIPLFECPDTTLEKIYYYRWWTFTKHLKQTPDGFVFTEFISPMKHGGKYNTISSGLGHHINEGRWLQDPRYINDYLNFWLNVDNKTTKPHLRAFSSWLQDAVYNLYLVRGDKTIIQNNLLRLDEDYAAWEQEQQLPNRMFWQYDVKDAMEESISGGRKAKNIRPTINSYMYGNAVALGAMSEIVGNDTLKSKYNAKAKLLKKLVMDSLWDVSASFFKVRLEKGEFSDAREAIGFIPWYFNLPDDRKEYAKQWDQLTDTTGFKAPWGLTTAERRHPLFRTHGSGHGCEWDGAVWPYATTQTLKGLSNLLSNYNNRGSMTSNVFYNELHTYAWSHQKRGLPYLGEYQDEKNGEWLKGDNPRSSYYNHSGFVDLIINDLIGLKPRKDNILEIKPLIPQNKWSWFCLDNVAYHGKMLSMMYDKTGTKYRRGRGFFVFADGKQIYHATKLKPIEVKM